MNRIRQLPPLFWIGLFPVVLLLWAWADSLKTETHWTKSYPGDHLDWAVLANSKLMWGRVTVDRSKPHQVWPGSRWWGELGRFENHSAELRGKRLPLFAPFSDREAWRYDQGSNYIHTRSVLPLWCLPGGYLPLWLGISWWQARRRRITRESEREAILGKP